MENLNEKRLVDFGNYLLSEKRNENVRNSENLLRVTHADLENFYLLEKEGEGVQQ